MPVVLEPHEKKEAAMMHRLSTMYKDKQEKRRKEARTGRKKERRKQEGEER